MKINIATLESMGSWEVSDQDEYMNIIDLMWDFKCKRHPGELIKKFKDQFLQEAINSWKELISLKPMRHNYLYQR